MKRWDQGSLGEMRVDTLLSMLQREIGLLVMWLPLKNCPQAIEVIRERELDLYGRTNLDEVYGIAFQECLQGIVWQMRQDSKNVGSLIVDTPDKWRWMYGQGVVGPVRVGVIRDIFNLRVRVGIRVMGIPYMLARTSETRVVLSVEQARLKVEA